MLEVGRNGTMTVTGAGSVLSNDSLQLGRGALSTGTVSVNTDGTINTTDTVQVGRDSATINAHTVIIATNTGSTGTANITDIGAQLNLSGVFPATGADQDGAVLLVGRNGTGTLNINTGGTVTVTPGTPVGTGLSGGMVIGG